MFLKKLKLTNFRNYSSLNFSFKTPITVLIGENAQGKSNFLESIYFLAVSKSPKAEREDELIREGEEVVRVEGELADSTFLEIVIQSVEGSLNKRVKVNGISRRVADYSEKMAVILFSPEDVNLVSGSPSLRRSHIDSVISQADRRYKKTVSAYEDVITRKNRVLKRIREEEGKLAELTFWTDQQILLGAQITQKREEFFEFLNSTQKKFGECTFEYIKNEVNLERLNEYQSREIILASSLVGPHRDDFIFKLNNKELSKFGSRGEQRTAVLDLKISEVEYIEMILGERPILLLDDIFSELDVSHRQHVVDLAKLQQTVIATVEWDKYLEKALKNSSLFSVESGQISERVGK